MTEFEQMKKEYKEIPVPAEVPQQMLATIAKAKSDRSRRKNPARYATIAAAVLMVAILLPGMLLLGRTVGGSAKNNFMSADCLMESATSAGGDFFNGSTKEEDCATGGMAPEEEAPETAAPMTSVGGMEATEEGADFGILQDEAEKINGAVALDWDMIYEELFRQMKEGMAERGETYYIGDAKNWEECSVIKQWESFYFNKDGLLVVVFDAGVAAPKEQGILEFSIPAEVVAPAE